MRLSTRGQYALEAMLALVVDCTGRPVSLKEISSRTALPRPYLEHLFANLRKAGLVRSERGSQGGYELAVASDKLTAGHVLRAAEGHLSTVRCTMDDDPAGSCSRLADCRTRPVWVQLDQVIQTWVDQMTLADLARSFREQQDDQADQPGKAQRTARQEGSASD